MKEPCNKTLKRGAWMHTVGKVILTSFFISLSWKTYALSVSTSKKCPNHFVGEVVNMVDSSTPFSSLKKVKIDFYVSSRLKGEDREYEEVYYPKSTLTKFKIGDKFEVSMKDGLLCSLTRK